MKTYLAKIAVLVLVLLTTTSCATLFSSSKTTAKSPWREFAEAKAAYDRVEAGRTSVGQMRELGFDPYASQNLKVLNYLEVLNRFIPNNSVRVEDLPLAVRTFLAAQEKAVAYELEVTAIRGSALRKPLPRHSGIQSQDPRDRLEFQGAVSHSRGACGLQTVVGPTQH